MNKTEFLDRCARTGEERVLLSRVLDKAARSRLRSTPEHTDFLTPAEQILVEDVLRLYGDVRYVLCGGYEGAERRICLFLPDWMEAEYLSADADGVLAAVSADIRYGEKLSHRDVLGALMGVGLTREKLGDILLTENEAQVIVLKSAAEIILSQWDGVGRYKIEPRRIPLEELVVRPPQVKEITDTVAALRLDSVLASGFSCPGAGRENSLPRGGWPWTTGTASRRTSPSGRDRPSPVGAWANAFSALSGD
jgi:RNA-binding protein YlmH